MGQCGDRFCAAGRACASICPLTNWLTAARTGPADSAALSFGYGSAGGIGRFFLSIGCGAGRFYVLGIRRQCVRQSLCEHLPSDKLTANGACGTDRFFYPIIRMRRRGQNRQILPPHRSGAAARAGPLPPFLGKAQNCGQFSALPLPPSENSMHKLHKSKW